DGRVYDLEPAAGAIYAGGDFTTVGGLARNRIAALDTASGAATAWNPNADRGVRSIDVDGNTVYVGGPFTTIGGAARSRTAALDVGSGLATPWNPSASDSVLTLLVSGSTVFAGGSFQTIGGLARANLAAILISCPAPGGIGNASVTLGHPDASTAGDFDGDGM